MNILIVDDEVRSAYHLGQFLRKFGHQVTEQADGLNAKETLKTNNFDLVLTDNRMPGISGMDLLYHIKSLPSAHDTEVAIISAYSTHETKIEALNLGACDCLSKPIDLDRLLSLIDRIAEKQIKDRKNIKLSVKKSSSSVIENSKPELIAFNKALAKAAGLEEVCVKSDQMMELYNLAKNLHMDPDIPVLIEGETGTGKELMARYIHYGEEGTTAPFIAINCSAIPPGMFENELFGYEAGSFTGALPNGKKGKIDLAGDGTLFLDEIGDLPMDFQAKLLRLLQEKEFYRIGGLKVVKVNLRIICATNIDLEEAVANGTFRKDLFYRLSIGRIVIPPLRERPEDIIPLAQSFLKQFSRKKNKQFRAISNSAQQLLLQHDWPGNVRELKNVIRWAVFTYDDGELQPWHLRLKTGGKINTPELSPTPVLNLSTIYDMELPADRFSLEDMINQIIRKALIMHKGNKTETAKYLGISRSTLYNRLNGKNK